MIVNWVFVPLGSGWENVEPDDIVWLDIAAVEKSFLVDRNEYVGPGGSCAGQRSRYENVGLLIQSGRPIYMPHLSINDDDTIVFTDGRHRFAWVRDHGAGALPVTTDPKGAARLATRFGTKLRETWILG